MGLDEEIEKGRSFLKGHFKGNEQEVATYMAQRRSELKSKILNQGRGRAYYFRMAAVLLLIAVAGFLVYQVFFVPDLLEKYQNEHYPAELTQRAGSQSVRPWKEYYEQHQYARALRALEEKDESSREAEFFAGLCQNYLGNWQKAAIKLNDLALDRDDYQEQARWYLALIFIQQDEYSKADSLLTLLETGVYENQVRQLRDQYSDL